MRTFFLVHNHVSLMFGSRARRLNVFAQNSSHLCVMSLLGVPVSRFPPIASSPTCSLSRPSASSTPLVRTRSPPCASAPWGGMSGYLANPTPDTGYESKFCVDASDEHTPINLTESNRNFSHDYDATIATTENLDVPRHYGAASIFQHTVAVSRVPTLSKQGSLGNSLTKVLAEYDSVGSRNSIWETCADPDRETVVSTLFRSESKAKREIENKKLCNRQVTGKISTKSLNGKLYWPSLERHGLCKNCMKLREKWREKYWWKKNSDIALHEIDQEFESQRFQLQQGNRWADRAQRDKISLYGELKLRNKLFQEKSCKGLTVWRIEKNLLRRNRSSKTSKHRWIVHASRAESYDCESVVDSDSGMKEQSKFPVGFDRILRNWIREQLWSDPRSQSTLHYAESQDHASPRFWIAAWSTEYYGYFRERFWPTICSKKDDLLQSTTIHRIWHPLFKNQDLILHELQRDQRVKWKENRWIRQSHYSISKVEVVCWIVLWNLFPQWYDGLSETPDFGNAYWTISRLYGVSKLEKSTSRLKYVRNQQIFVSQSTGSKKLRQQKLTDELVTSRTIVGRTDFTKFDLLNTMIASALKGLSNKHINFRKRVSKRSVLKNTTDSYVGDKLLAWSLSIPVQLELMKR